MDAKAVVGLLGCYIVVPQGGGVVLDHIDVSRIGRVFEIKQVAGGSLLVESGGDMVDNMFQTDEKPLNGISG